MMCGLSSTMSTRTPEGAAALGPAGWVCSVLIEVSRVYSIVPGQGKIDPQQPRKLTATAAGAAGRATPPTPGRGAHASAAVERLLLSRCGCLWDSHCRIPLHHRGQRRLQVELRGVRL